MKGLNQFSHAIVVTFLDRAHFNRAEHIVRRPRGLDTMPAVGIFAQRAKDRPNPSGITAVTIVRAAEGVLEVMGLDAINGTPVLDIKPYFVQYDFVRDAIVPEWVGKLMVDYF